MNESSEFAEIEKIEREKKKTPKGQGKIVDFLLAELLKIPTIQMWEKVYELLRKKGKN